MSADGAFTRSAARTGAFTRSAAEAAAFVVIVASGATFVVRVASTEAIALAGISGAIIGDIATTRQLCRTSMATILTPIITISIRPDAAHTGTDAASQIGVIVTPTIMAA